MWLYYASVDFVIVLPFCHTKQFLIDINIYIDKTFPSMTIWPVMCLVYPSAVCRPLSDLDVSAERSSRLHRCCVQHTGMSRPGTAGTVLSNIQDLAVTGLFWTHQHSTHNIPFKPTHTHALKRSQWSSGIMSDCSMTDTRIEPCHIYSESIWEE